MNSEIDFLVIASPRSGSSLFRNYLNSVDVIGIPPESPFPLTSVKNFGHQLPHWGDRISGSRFVSDFLGSEPKLSHWALSPDKLLTLAQKNWPETWPEFVRLVYQAYFDKYPSPPSILGDKNNSYISHLESLPNAFSEPILIHLIRDPRQVVGSQLAFTSKKRPPFAPHFADDPKILFDNWAAENRGVEEFAEAKKLRIKRVHYEQFVSNPSVTVLEVAEFVGFALPSDFVSTNSWSRYPEPESFLAWKSKSVEAAESPRITESDNYLESKISGEALDTIKRFGY